MNLGRKTHSCVLALQGWLDFELAAAVIRRQQTLYRYNFKRDILPLFQVSGMAAQFIRYLVSHLEDCLKRALRADMILNMNHGLPLAYFYYLMTVPSAAEKRSYQKLVPHKWTRAIFVCKKSKEFVPVALLGRGRLVLVDEPLRGRRQDVALTVFAA